VRVVDVVEPALVREALVLERLEQDLEPLLVTVARLDDGDAGLDRHPPVPADDAELVAAVPEDVELRDLRGEDRRGVVGQRVPSVRNAIIFVRSAAMPNSAQGFAEIENRGKNQCSMTA